MTVACVRDRHHIGVCPATGDAVRIRHPGGVRSYYNAYGFGKIASLDSPAAVVAGQHNNIKAIIEIDIIARSHPALQWLAGKGALPVGYPQDVAFACLKILYRGS